MYRGLEIKTAGFAVLRELTATDLKGSLLQLLYESGLSEMELGTAFFMNHTNKKRGACLYNKRLTSTLNTLPQETCNCQS